MTNTPITPEQLKKRVRDLPAFPAVVMELISSLGNDDLAVDDVAEKLARDLALSAKVLRMANSSFYGMTRQIGTIPEALNILGLRTVRTVVMAAGVTGGFKMSTGTNFDFTAFWRHSVGTALCAQALAQELNMDSDLGFTVGLLHDIGRVALAYSFPEAYEKVMAYQAEHDVLGLDAERAVLGTDHAVMGGQIAQHWRFSPAIAEAIENHHSPAMHHGPGLVGLAHVADAFSHALGLSGQVGEVVPLTPPEIWGAMAPNALACFNILERVETQFEEVCQALQV